ncbi:MAG: hypothetical protein Q6365_023635 [Candidatus Sigynarchaeota archaeon]
MKEELPVPKDECKKCPVYKRLIDYSDGLFVKNEEIAKMQQDIIKLKSGLSRVERKVSKHQEDIESLKHDLDKCREENRKLKELVQKQEVVSSYYSQELAKVESSINEIIDLLRSQGINVDVSRTESASKI